MRVSSGAIVCFLLAAVSVNAEVGVRGRQAERKLPYYETVSKADKYKSMSKSYSKPDYSKPEYSKPEDTKAPQHYPTKEPTYHPAEEMTHEPTYHPVEEVSILSMIDYRKLLIEPA